MRFAVHYSRPAADLVDAGAIAPDFFKCPAWPDLIATVQANYPIYVHFPLRVGSGIGDAIDTETHQPAGWKKIETLLTQTDTPFVNLHLEPTVHDHYGGVGSLWEALTDPAILAEQIPRLSAMVHACEYPER